MGQAASSHPLADRPEEEGYRLPLPTLSPHTPPQSPSRRPAAASSHHHPPPPPPPPPPLPPPPPTADAMGSLGGVSIADISCPICMAPYDPSNQDALPLTLPTCGHTLCRACLNNLLALAGGSSVSSAESREIRVACPWRCASRTVARAGQDALAIAPRNWPIIQMIPLLQKALAEREVEGAHANQGAAQKHAASQPRDGKSEAERADVMLREEAAGSIDAIVLLYASTWEACYLHCSIEDREWTALPGHLAARLLSHAPLPLFRGYHVAMVEGRRARFAFHDGKGAWDSNDGKDYTVDSPGVYALEQGVVTRLDTLAPASASTPSRPPLSAIFYHSTWTNCHIHHTIATPSLASLSSVSPSQPPSSSSSALAALFKSCPWTAPPGIPMMPMPAHVPAFGGGMWMWTLVSGSCVQFAVNDGQTLWDSNKGHNYTLDRPGLFKLRDGALRS